MKNKNLKMARKRHARETSVHKDADDDCEDGVMRTIMMPTA